MELEVVDREEQALMDREEITVEISHVGEATPSAAAVRDKIAAELDLDPKTVEIANIHSSTGLSVSRGTVRVHDEPIFEELPEDGDDAEEDGEEEAEETEEDGDEDSEAEDDEAVEDEGADEEESDDDTGEEDVEDETEEDTEEEESDEDGADEEEEPDADDEKDGDS